MQSKMPKVVADYIRSHPVYADVTDIPVVRQAFAPGKGWFTTGYSKRLTVTWARKMIRGGWTVVGLEIAPGRIADFRLTEIVRGGAE